VVTQDTNKDFIWCATVDGIWSAVYLGVKGSRLLVDRCARCASYELDGDARHRQGFNPGSAAVRV